MEQKPVAVSCLLLALVFTLQGCGTPPPAACYRLEFENGALPMTDKDKSAEPECDDGYEYDGPTDITCNMINKECLVSDPSSCHNVHAFGPDGTGLESFPEDAEPMLVTKFTHSWEDYIRARAGKGVGDTSKFMKEKAAYAAESAQAALDKSKEYAEKAKEEAQKAKEKAAEAVELARSKGEEHAAAARKAAERAAAKAQEASDKARELANHAAEQAREVAEAAKNSAADVSGSMKAKAAEAAEHAEKFAEDAKDRAHSALDHAKDAASDLKASASEHAANAKEHASSALEDAKTKTASALDAAKEHVHEATGRRLSDGITPSYSVEDMQGKCKPKAGASRLYLMLPRILRRSGGFAPQLLVAMLVCGVFGMALIVRKLTVARQSSLMADEISDEEVGSSVE